MPGQYPVIHLNCTHIKKVSAAYARLVAMGTKVYCTKCKTKRTVIYKTTETR